MKVLRFEVLIALFLGGSGFLGYDAVSVGRDSVAGIATRDRLEGQGIESQREERFSPPVETFPGTHPASCTLGTGSFPGVG